ncbi:MAG TPA: gephyrin-like molybdotransferase Glp [Gemmataceae bacterium]|nr:gephyrin-like molybdotransferase Glp [Gemmataceae bacterium]
MLEVSAALEIVLGRTQRLKAVTVPLNQAALGRVVAADIASDIDSPPYAKSVMDGYAIRSDDTATNLAVIEEVAAGRMPTRTVAPGQAARVMTGAPIPDGADAVIPHEETKVSGDRVEICRPVARGKFILPRAKEMRAGEVVIPAGTKLTPAVFGLLSAVGRTDVSVYPAPRLAIISTGDELVEPLVRPGPGQIRNTNGPMLAALTARAGAEARYLGIARDDKTGLEKLVRDGLEHSEVLVLSGGVSAGKYDFVPDVLRESGVEAHFHKVRMKPGKPLLFGTRGETLVFGLPGNPVSSFVGFELFVRPTLRKMSGEAIPGPTFVPVPLAENLTTDNDRPTFAPATLQWTSEGLRVSPAGWFGSADLRGLLNTDALISLPAGAVAYASGFSVPTLPL